MPRHPPTIWQKLRKIFLPPLFHLSLSVLIITLVATISLLISSSPPQRWNYNELTIDYANPFKPQDVFQPFDQEFKFNVLIDVHSHTDVGGAQISPEISIQWHIANGYNAMVVTDHNDIARAFAAQKLAQEKYSDIIVVLVGEEWSNCRMHMGLLGITEPAILPKWPTDLEIQHVINETHRQGGVVVVNHVPWSYSSGLDMPSLDDLVKWGVDYFDVTTGQAFDLQRVYYARSKGVGVVAATDVHEVTSAHEWTLLNVEGNITSESVLDALRTRKTSFFFDFIGHMVGVQQTHTPEKTEYTAAYPWLLLSQFFHAFYWRSEPGTYSFVDGPCTASGRSIWTFDKVAIRVTIGWFLLSWLVLEIVCGLTKFGFVKLMARFRPKKYIDEDSETPLLDLWKQ